MARSVAVSVNVAWSSALEVVTRRKGHGAEHSVPQTLDHAQDNLECRVLKGECTEHRFHLNLLRTPLYV